MKPHSIGEVEIRLNHEGLKPYDPRIFGWASVVIDKALKLNEIIIFKDMEGRLSLRFPRTKSRKGVRYSIFNPINKEFARQLETAVLGKLNDLKSNLHPGKESV